MPVFIVGRFPPPIDGQTIATRRLAELLAPTHAVHRLNTEPPPPSAYVAERTPVGLDRVRHFVRLRREFGDRLGAAPDATVLWPAVSPAPLGHWRDLVTTVPCFHPRQRVFAVVHRGNFDRLFRSPLTALTARLLVRRLAGIVFLDEPLAERCARWIPSSKRFAIPNTLDDAELCTDAEVNAKIDLPRKRPLRLLFLSNMIPSKGYLDVLHAARLLYERGVSLRVDFAGRWASEADRVAFERDVEESGLRDVVVHHGPVSERAEIKALHLAADIFLLPTYYPTEAQPITIIEALNAATPVVTTRHAGIPNMVRDGEEALFVPPRAPEAIARAVEHLADDDRWRRASRAARRRFEEVFSPASVRRQWVTLVDEGS